MTLLGAMLDIRHCVVQKWRTRILACTFLVVPLQVLVGAENPFEDTTISVPAIAQKGVIVVEGVASLADVSAGTRDVVAKPGGGSIGVNRFSVPFKVKQTSDSSVPGLINLNLYIPLDVTKQVPWSLPLKESLFLILKPSGHSSNTYEIIDPLHGWIIATSAKASLNLNSDNKTAVLVDGAKNYLLTKLEQPDQHEQYFNDPEKPDRGFDFRQNDPATINALLIAARLSNGAPEIRMLLAKFVDQAGLIGQIARNALGNEGDYSALIERLKDFDAKKLTDRDQFNFPHELETAITSSDLSTAMPLIALASASPNPQVRVIVASALRERRKSEPLVYPLLVNMLRDSDPNVQLQAMAGIYETIKTIDKPSLRRNNLHLPLSMDDFKQNTNTYITPYLDWWSANASKYSK